MIGLTLPQLALVGTCVGALVFGIVRPPMKWIELGILVLVGVALVGIEILIDRTAYAVGSLSPRTVREILLFERPMLTGTALVMGYACVLTAMGNTLRKYWLRLASR